MDFAQTEADRARRAKKKRFLVFFRRRRREFLLDQIHRVIEQHAGRFTGLFVVQDLPAKRIGRFGIDPGGFQRCAVCDRAVAVGSHQEYRIVWRNLIQVLASRKNRRLPERLDPATSVDPAAGSEFFGLSLHRVEKELKGRRVLEIQADQTFPHPKNVVVRIGESRHHCFPFQVDHARGAAGVFLCVRVRADEGDAIAFDRDRFGFRGGVIHGVNGAVREDDVGRPGIPAFDRGGRPRATTRRSARKMVFMSSSADRFSRKAAMPSLASADSRASM